MAHFLVDTGGTLITGLQAYWPLNESQRSRYDLINPGTGPAALFVAANSESFTHTSNTSLQTGDIDFAFACWVYLNTTGVTQYILAKGTAAGGGIWEYELKVNTSNAVVLQVRDGGSGTIGAIGSSATLSAATWYFIVAWHDSVANTVNVQVNNGTVDSAATTGAAGTNAQDFRIGAQNAPSNFFDGRIQLVGFWKKVLSSTERTSLYNSGNGKDYRRLSGSEKTSLISFWNLHEGSGVRYDFHGANDLTDNNTVGRIAGVDGGNTLGDNNTVGMAVGKTDITQAAGQFINANSEYLSLPDNAAFNIGDADFTLACWVYLDSLGERYFLSRRRPGVFEFSLKVFGVPNIFEFAVSPDGSASTGVTSSVTPSTATWHFFVCWHDSVANTINIQVNNGTVDSLAYTGGVHHEVNNSFNLGLSHPTEPTTMDGRIDEVGFWKKVLTAQERTDLYNNGNGNSLIADGNTPGVDAPLLAPALEFMQLFP